MEGQIQLTTRSHEPGRRSEIFPELPRSILMTLPVELLAEICSHLCQHCRSKDNAKPCINMSPGMEGFGTILWRPPCEGRLVFSQMRDGDKVALSHLSRTSKYFRTVAQPFLFHYVNARRASDFYWFIRTLVEQPDLRAKVCQVRVTNLYEVPNRSSPDPPSNLMTHTVKESLRCGQWTPLWESLVSSRDRAGNVADTVNERFAAQVSLLLHLTPNLASASFRLWGLPRDASFRVFDQWNPPLKLKSLKRLFLTAYEPSKGLNPDAAIHILRAAPNIEVLHLRHCVDVPERSQGRPSRIPIDRLPRLPELTELKLTMSGLRVSGMQRLLGTVGSKLSKVTIEDASINGITLEETLQVLMPFTTTLRELRHRGLNWHPQTLQRFPVSLRDFTSLEILDIQASAFKFSVQHKDSFAFSLPSSLRELRLVGYTALSTVITGVLEALVTGQLPHLIKIQIMAGRNDSWDTVQRFRETLTEVIAAFQSAGVELITHLSVESSPEFCVWRL